jgi:CheY-like chemotaxis protein
MAAMVMLTSAGWPGDIAHCQELGLDAHLIKPIKQSELLDTILAALSGTAACPAPPVMAAGSSSRVPAGVLRILLAEDNPVNQLLAVRLLEKQGHTTVVAGNGKEALAALQASAFDVILMDVQMPEMDGLKTAAAIRQAEQGSERHIPILALTAHAMTGDRQRCLEAGMDGYLTKPIQAQELYDALAGLGLPRAAHEPEAADAAVPTIDRAQALDFVGGDARLLRELAQLFLGSYPTELAAVRLACERNDLPALGRAAHAMKGSIRIFDASACEAAQRIETLARAGDATHIAAACAALETALAALRPALAALAAEDDAM